MMKMQTKEEVEKASELKAQLCNTLEAEMDERFEALSDKVRMGIPIDFSETLEVIEYQERIQAEHKAKRSKNIIGRLMRWIRGA